MTDHRDEVARIEVMAILETAYERFAVDEQLARPSDPELAEDLHRTAVRLLRARMAEEDDPKLQTPTVHCLNCAAAYAAGGQ